MIIEALYETNLYTSLTLINAMQNSKLTHDISYFGSIFTIFNKKGKREEKRKNGKQRKREKNERKEKEKRKKRKKKMKMIIEALYKINLYTSLTLIKALQNSKLTRYFKSFGSTFTLSKGIIR